MARMAGAQGDDARERGARAAADKALSAFRSRFWDPDGGLYVYAFNAGGEKVREVTPWPSFGLAWGLGGVEETGRTLERLCRPDLLTDWGVRMMSSESRYFEPLNYNYGAVWPFLTGWMAAALYRNGFPLQGHSALKANVRHSFDNGLGSVTELFSGLRNIWPAEAVAHQGFSTGGVVLPLVKGLLGLEVDASSRTLFFRPSFPGDWEEVSLEGVRAGGASFDLEYKRGNNGIAVRIASRGGEGWTVVVQPTLGPAALIREVRLNGAVIPFLDISSERAVRPEAKFSASASDVLEFDIPPVVEILPPEIRSDVGAPSLGLRIESLRGDESHLEITVWGCAGGSYALPLKHGERVRSIDGAALGESGLKIEFPSGPRGKSVSRTIVLHLD
ncbi:MAG: hypothetical protein A2Y56_03060 [Candidatus Aminicenantes bacterium RBG_13_63_10]|nr:MAG: hypothetical protein A2Y56_03060 [Candidatus Aminicenantes bacterium RBG_13_63_10]